MVTNLPDISKKKITNLDDINDMFSGCEKLTSISAKYLE